MVMLSSTTQDLVVAKGLVEFHNVSFGYDASRAVLDVLPIRGFRGAGYRLQGVGCKV